MLGAYIAFFTMWTNLYDNLHVAIQLLSGLMIAISASTFVFFEIYKMANDMNFFYDIHVAYEKMNEWESEGVPEKSLTLRTALAARHDSKRLSSYKTWKITFGLSVATGLLAALLLIGDTTYCLILKCN